MLKRREENNEQHCVGFIMGAEKVQPDPEKVDASCNYLSIFTKLSTPDRLEMKLQKTVNGQK